LSLEGGGGGGGEGRKHEKALFFSGKRNETSCLMFEQEEGRGKKGFNAFFFKGEVGGQPWGGPPCSQMVEEWDPRREGGCSFQKKGVELTTKEVLQDKRLKKRMKGMTKFRLTNSVEEKFLASLLEAPGLWLGGKKTGKG